MVISNQTISFGYSPTCNLPIIRASNSPPPIVNWKVLSACITIDNNQNLSEGQKELLKWHFRLGHLNARQIQVLLKTHILGKTRLITAASNCTVPKCASCQFGKGRKTPSSTSTHTPTGTLKGNDLYPGQCISADHFHSSSKGRTLESRGKTLPDDMYSGGIIFVDHASGYIYLEPLVSLNVEETLTAKHKFERFGLEHGVVIQAYHTDNGILTAHDFMKELLNSSQTIKFSGVGAHHQNGIAERAIGTIMSMARTMMLHAAIRWPDVADSSLWPMATQYATYIYNHMPKLVTGIAPI
jgi:GAG-pre-integrase domain